MPTADSSDEPAFLLASLVGQVVVVDLSAPYVCLGTLARFDRDYLELVNADVHDFRDSQATREVYVFDSAHVGIRRNRARALIRRAEVIALARLADVTQS